MNRTTRTTTRLLLALPMAAAALTLSAGVAQADEPFPITHPVPDDDPKGPGDITNPEPGDDPTGPGDLTNPEPGDDPTGPGDLTNPEPGDDPGDDNPGDKTGNKPGDEPGAGNDTVGGSGVEVPTRIDAGVVPNGEEHLDLVWLLAGGGLVVASGAALAGQQARRTHR